MAEDLRPRGRPQDTELDRRIVEATWALVRETALGEVTIAQIARRADVSRPAIYRRWRSVEEIVIEAFLRLVDDAVPTPEPQDAAAALRVYIGSLVGFLASPVGQVIAELLGRAQRDDDLLEAFHDSFLTRRRDHGRALIARGQAAGQFRSDVDSEAIIDLYAGPIYFRAFSRHGPLDDRFADHLSRLVLAGLRAG